MVRKIILDKYEQDIEDNIENQITCKDSQDEIKTLIAAAKRHSSRKKSVTIRIHESDLEIMRIKAIKLGIPYQTYINMLIHLDATSL